VACQSSHIGCVSRSLDKCLWRQVMEAWPGPPDREDPGSHRGLAIRFFEHESRFVESPFRTRIHRSCS
jgi:hypothetical protein